VVIREAVPMHGLRSSNALMQQVMFIMRIIGPAAAGMLVASFGANACYWWTAPASSPRPASSALWPSSVHGRTQAHRREDKARSRKSGMTCKRILLHHPSRRTALRHPCACNGHVHHGLLRPLIASMFAIPSTPQHHLRLGQRHDRHRHPHRITC